MTQTISLELPESIYLPVRRMAEATQRPIADVLVTALKVSLPSLEGLSLALSGELFKLEQLADDGLWQVMLSQVPAAKQRKLENLLNKNKSGKLKDSEKNELATLQNDADRVMLHKARAAVLLRFRGHRLPTLAELRKLTQTNGK